MANTLNIIERTTVQLADSTNSVNVLGVAADNRVSPLSNQLVRITDHDDDTGATGTDSDNMALFTSKEHGAPFVKQGFADNGQVKTLVGHATPASTGADRAFTHFYPNFDYSTFT